VGSGGTVLHWNGALWAPVASGTTVDLGGVWGRSSTDVWIAGSGTVLHWDGTQWKSKAVNATRPLSAIWGSSAGSTWVVGGGGAILRAGP
jgi:hypothetical protein